jgi:hypothetical protein
MTRAALFIGLVLLYAGAVAFFLSASAARADTLAIRDSAEGHSAEVYFYNSELRNSVNWDTVMSHGGVDVRVQVEVNGRGPERITVDPVDHNYIAVPWQAEIEDGHSVVIQIMRAGGLS